MSEIVAGCCDGVKRKTEDEEFFLFFFLFIATQKKSRVLVSGL